MLFSSNGLSEAINRLNMDVSHSPGLKWVENKENETNPYIRIVLEQAQAVDAVAVYFRFFTDERPPRPQVFIYSFKDLNTAKSKGAEIHHHLWNAGMVPYCFIYGVSEILVYSCNDTPEIDSKGKQFITKPHDRILLLGKIQEELFKKYSARKFDSGLFWDTESARNIKYEHSAYEQLLTQLKNVKNIIITRSGKENTGLVKRILIILILIKYLEERKDENGKAALEPVEFYSEFSPEEPSLSGVLKNADRTIAVLSKLCSNEHFNGQVFLLSDDEKQGLKSLDFQLFQHFVEGNISFFTDKTPTIGQMSLWRLYSFNYLPIELISHIYEDFLTDENGQKKKGVVYTPPYLVQFLIDRCMPLDTPRDSFKVFDPACGSGIFLVGAFKRMIQWWRIRNNWKKPQKENIEELKGLLLSNIYGCDIEEEAVRLSYFSVSLALLDALSPKEIWKNVHFDNLMGGNLFAGDFFLAVLNRTLPQNFDLIIGNPPFQSEFTVHANRVDLNESLAYSQRPKIPDNQIALLFLEQSLKLLKKGGNCCLILSSGPLLYNTNAHDYKRYLFENYHFREVYDFTPLRAKLFKSSSASAKPAALAVLTQNERPSNEPIYHLIFRRTKASGEKIEFEIDHYDIYKVPYNVSIASPKVWQANFMGGGRLHQLMDKIDDLMTLNDYLEEKKKKKKWKIAEGWIESDDALPLKRIKLLLAKERITDDEKVELAALESKHKAEWITGKPYANITKDGSLKNEISSTKYFLRPRKKNKAVFEPPHLLIHESVKHGEIPMWFLDEYVTFKDSIFGIHAPRQDEQELKNIQNYLSAKHNVALIWLRSGKVITMREGVPLMGDILSLPYPTVEFNEIEKTLLDDIVDYYSEFRKDGEKSEILDAPTPKDLKAFGAWYSRILNSVYENFKPGNPVIGKDFICYPFILGNSPEVEIPDSIDNIEKKLKYIIDNQTVDNLWVRRIVKVYEKNIIFLYKPNQKRYWLKSIAIRDADETFVDLFKQGK